MAGLTQIRALSDFKISAIPYQEMRSMWLPSYAKELVAAISVPLFDEVVAIINGVIQGEVRLPESDFLL